MKLKKEDEQKFMFTLTDGYECGEYVGYCYSSDSLRIKLKRRTDLYEKYGYDKFYNMPLADLLEEAGWSYKVVPDHFYIEVNKMDKIPYNITRSCSISKISEN